MVTTECNSFFTPSNRPRLLCDKVKDEYSDYSNIVICIYNKSTVGRDLARGKNNGIGIEELQKAWMAMYTYNPVEGAYFDNNPGGYLGAY